MGRWLVSESVVTVERELATLATVAGGDRDPTMAYSCRVHAAVLYRFCAVVEAARALQLVELFDVFAALDDAYRNQHKEHEEER